MIDKAKFEVLQGSKHLELTMSEFDILWLLASKPGIIFSLEELAHEIKDHFPCMNFQVIHNCIGGLKGKVGGEHIQWIEEKGYRLDL